jgi:prolyl-tRNA synthetase
MHRWSQLFVPTLREAPADAEVASHKFLVRAGYIRQLAAGLYNYLFLGQRTILNITNVVREEMDKIGQEFYLSELHPREVWEDSGRWSVMGENMFRLKDRKGADLCLGMTEEEIMSEIARKELRSYKQLPQIWYQIQAKFRDEPRPKSGLLRVRRFTMKDAYSFDMDAAGLDVSYKKHYETYCRIFDRCGLDYVAVQAHSGAMGGSESHEFMVYTDAGEDLVASCPKCGYAANLERAESKFDPIEDLAPSGDGNLELIYTPGKGAIADIAEFLQISPKQDIKAVAYMADLPATNGAPAKQQAIAVFLRGDHTVNEAKLQKLLKVNEIRPMHQEELERYFEGPGGFIGPVGVVPRPADQLGQWEPDLNSQSRDMNVILDAALVGRKNMICGANKLDYHFRNVTPGKDFQFTVAADVRNVNEGEGCPVCGTPLKLGKAVEIGHIFKLGYKYSDSMGVRVLDKDGKEVTPIMGSYGIGIERILTAIVEQNHDDNGFWLPSNVAPFQVVVVPTNMGDDKLAKAGLEIAERLEAAGFDVLLDDRDERPGVKFKDADLIGVPFRVTIGKKLSEGKVEVLRRSTRESQDVTIAELVDRMKVLIKSAEGRPRASEAGASGSSE